MPMGANSFGGVDLTVKQLTPDKSFNKEITIILKLSGRFSCSPYEMRQSPHVFMQLFSQTVLVAAEWKRDVL